MSFNAEKLYSLLPEIHRLRDAEIAGSMSLLTAAETSELESLEALASPTEEEQTRLLSLRDKKNRGPLQSLLMILAEQTGVVEENLEQLYDDLFIETCADWVVPYIGDLIGYESLHGVVPEVASPRAEVAHTIALRRRKGTALVLEQLARDVTGWNARVVEFFERLATTQYMNHSRLYNHRCPDLRDSASLEWIDTAFESASRSVDVRRIASGCGRHNIPNVGLHLWRLNAYPHRDTPASRVGDRRYRISPLNNDLPLFSFPEAEEEITHIAEPFNVPLPLSRRWMKLHLDRYYGEQPSAGGDVDNTGPSVIIAVDDSVIERDRIDICDLSDVGAVWAHTPPNGRCFLDPQLGRIALPPDASDPAHVTVNWHEGFSADLGGGEYDRSDSLLEPSDTATVVRVPDDQPTLTAALAALAGDGVVILTDSGLYDETPLIQVAANGSIEIRADEGCRPILKLSAALAVQGGDGSRFKLNGVLVTGGALHVPNGSNELADLSLTHATLVPGFALTPAGEPTDPSLPGLVVEIPDIDVTLQRSILGGIRAHARAAVQATDCIIDATDKESVAFAAVDGESPGARLDLDSCTVIGKVHAREFGLVTDSILLAALAGGDSWSAPVRTERKQVGCVRFSFLPINSIVPRRYRCQPDSPEAARRIAPRFTSLRYGTPAYGQLAVTTPCVIRRGADDEGEMGVFHHLYGALREINLRVRLKEYLRVGLEAGIFYES